jgi:hypothetical protein
MLTSVYRRGRYNLTEIVKLASPFRVFEDHMYTVCVCGGPLFGERGKIDAV